MAPSNLAANFGISLFVYIFYMYLTSNMWFLVEYLSLKKKKQINHIEDINNIYSCSISFKP